MTNTVPDENRFVLITGCSGGGKSSLLSGLKGRGHYVVEEPDRRIVEEEKAGAGAALPWVDLAAFARRAVVMSRSDLASAQRKPRLIFFDRGLIDEAVALQFARGMSFEETIGSACPYNKTVFLAPPSPEIYETDEDRRHGLEAAMDEYERLLSVLNTMNCDIQLLPKVSVENRVDFVQDRL